MRRLEEAVGETLFDRSTRDGSLTDAGRVLLEYAQRLLRLADEAQLAVSELRDVQRGRADRRQRGGGPCASAGGGNLPEPLSGDSD